MQHKSNFETNTMYMDREQVLDRIKVMKIQEATSYRCSNYINTIPDSSSSNHVDVWCRKKMIEWCYQVVDFIEFSRETVIIAVSYLDRFMSSRSERALQVSRNRNEFQLAMMTCLYTAIKLHEPKVIDMKLLVELSRNSYTQEDFKQMEVDLLTSLNWLLNGPTAISFIEHYAVLLPFEGHDMHMEVAIETAKYQVEMCIAHYGLLQYNPSQIGLAALVDGIKSLTAVPALASKRPKLLSALQQISGTNLASASLRSLQRIVTFKDTLPLIQSRRNSAPRYYQPKTINRRGSNNMKQMQALSPRSCTH